MTNPLGDLISRGEGGYNSYNRGTLHGRIVAASQQHDFAQMTLEELTRRQKLPIDDADKVFAVGKYQVIPPTMRGAIAALNLEPSVRFGPDTQERIFSDYLIRTKRPAIYNYIAGAAGASLYGAQKAASQEWASIDDPDTPGKPFGEYGKHGNRSSIRAAQVAAALDAMRAAYEANIRRGRSADEAWRDVTGQASLTRQDSATLGPAKGLGAKHVVSSKAHDSIRAIQSDLLALGYHDGNGHPITIDNHLGPNTLHAIKSFQRAHHLHVDGIAGKQTLAALEDAQRWPLLSEATHPQHRLYSQVEQGIRKLPSHARSADREIENAAVALTIAAHNSGLRHVDHVVLGSNGINLFAVHGRMDDPAHRRVHVELAHAVAHTADHRVMAIVGQAPEHLHAMAATHHQSVPRPPIMTSP